MEAARVERRLAAILAADVAGYSRLMERDEVGTFARLKRLREELVEPVIARQGGRVVDLKGDGAMIEFRSALAAVEAAVEIQHAMQDQNNDLPEAERIPYRIGINMGEVIVDGGAIYGDGVNVAARIESLCEPGGVWLSRAVHNQVQGKLDLAVVPSGLHQVKNISGAVETFRVALDGTAATPAWPQRTAVVRRPRYLAAAVLASFLLLGGIWWFWPGERLFSEKPGVAVLPFANLSGDAATGRLADGITEDVIADLARFKDLDLIARNSTAVYKGKPVGIRQVGLDLNVAYVVEGSIQRQDERVRVTAQLIDAHTEAHLWSERWDRPAEDVFAVQAELAERLANNLGGYGLIAEASRAAARRKPPESLTAYDLYMLGVEAKHRMTRESWAEAVRLLKEAIGLDPRLARAWTALSWVHTLSAATDPTDAGARRAEALEAARRAVQLDPTDAEGHAALGSALGALGHLAQAEAAFDEALHLNPNHSGVLAAYASWASSFGKAEAGAAAAERLIRLDPNYPAWAAGGISYAFLLTGRFEEALRALERLPDEVRGRDHLIGEAVALAALGRVEEARTVVARAMARFPDISAEALVGRPSLAERDRERAVEAMGMVGFPTCARAEDLPKLQTALRLPECEAERRAVAPEKS